MTFNEIDEPKNEPILYRQVIAELADNGFNLTPAGQDTDQLMIVSAAGEMKAGRGDGVLYTMHFGNPVSGEEEEIEIGLARNNDGNNDGPEEASNESGPDTEGQPEAEVEQPDDEAKKDQILNRFLMIRVSFDESLLGEKPNEPSAPVEPVKPEGYVAAANPTKSENESASSEDDAAPTPEDNDNEQTEKELKDDRPEAFKEYDRLLDEFNQAKSQYEIQLTQFETATSDFAEKVAEGQKLVSELNERFGKWFYVISADNLESIQLTKADLISDKPKVEADIQPPAGLPARPNINLDGALPVIPEAAKQESTDESGEAESKDGAESGNETKTDETTENAEGDEESAETQSGGV